ncbi:MAG: glycosyl hydrolase 53 family protein [Patescibacteria group bacterium]|nr:glycosyl hydrolase 53 family protein [Patescibacteria group bacterium]
MKRKVFLITLILIFSTLILTGSFLVVSVIRKIPKSQKPLTTQSQIKTLKGVTFTPKGFSAGDFTSFLAKTKETGEVVAWSGDWNELQKESGGPKVLAELSSNYGYIPIVELQFFTQATGELLRPLTEENIESYKESAANFAQKYRPKYLGLGIEVNVLSEKSPPDFDKFVSLFNESYDAIKTVSPNTKIFTVFQLEKMKGLSGGLFGGVNDETKNEWPLLEKFQKSDIIAFTTYPSLIYKDPAEIPADYYLEIKNHTQKPIAFTEVGWPSGADILGWESSEEEQASFIQRFFELTKDLKPELAIWAFMYDQNTIEPFKTMGLINSKGTAKSAFEKLKNLKY